MDRANGLVAMIEDQINGAVDEDGHVQLVEKVENRDGTVRSGPSPLVTLHQKERQQLVTAARAAIDAGFQAAWDSAVRERQDKIFDLVESVVRGLGHDPGSPEVVAVVTRALAEFAVTTSARSELLAVPADDEDGVSW
ncbi:hypothetical protein [Frankia sp. AvcI1]|uniref:hypothetical protein n=1 Tax=Frankia sp. AvcI1 TaxID=573496 RepID=UPI002118A574|nr:hypothetical protein [Frankia sp. AvcI1]